ncbi:MAG: twin-arginine translocase subunit TatC [Chloroflexota bacterium]
MSKFFRGVWVVITAPFRALWWIVSLPFRWVKNGIGFLRREPSEQPLSDMFVSLTTEKETRQALVEEIEAFRKHLLRSVLWLAVGIGISFAFNQRMIEFLAVPVGGLESLKAIDVTESVGVFMRVSLIAGAAIAFIPIFFEFWLFAAPGLRPMEKTSSLIALPFAALLFIGGMAFAYYIILPSGLPILLNFIGVQAELRPTSYFNFVTGLMFWLGVAFEFPILIVALTMMRIVKPKMLKDQWRLAIVIIAILAAMITPTVDPVNMALVMVPTSALYFISIGLSYLVVFLQRKSDIEQETTE